MLPAGENYYHETRLLSGNLFSSLAENKALGSLISLSSPLFTKTTN